MQTRVSMTQNLFVRLRRNVWWRFLGSKSSIVRWRAALTRSRCLYLSPLSWIRLFALREAHAVCIYSPWHWSPFLCNCGCGWRSARLLLLASLLSAGKIDRQTWFKKRWMRAVIDSKKGSAKGDCSSACLTSNHAAHRKSSRDIVFFSRVYMVDNAIFFPLVSDGKYHMLPSGELLINDVSRADGSKTYRCRTHHQLTQESVVSINAGRIQLTGQSSFSLLEKFTLQNFQT